MFVKQFFDDQICQSTNDNGNSIIFLHDILRVTHVNIHILQ